MITFDFNKISTEIAQLKIISTALGGSIQIINPNPTSKKDSLIRIPTPLSITRNFIKKHSNITRYFNPTTINIIKYDGNIIALEKYPLPSTSTPIDWIPNSNTNLIDFIQPTTSSPSTNAQWFFDGRFIFSFKYNNFIDIINDPDSIPLNFNKSLLSIPTQSIDTQSLHDIHKLQITQRSSLAINTPSAQYISPPIWKDISSLAKSSTQHNNTPTFDFINQHMAINLNFALKSSSVLANIPTLPFNIIEPLQLPRLMIELNTVNLPNLPNSIKSTYNINLNFQHTIAWLLGLLHTSSHSLQQYSQIRSLIKYLTTKSLFRINTLQHNNIFISPTLSLSDIKLTH